MSPAFHRHRFTDINKNFVPPAPGGSKFSNLDEYTLMQLTNGYTVINQRCECGKYNQEILLGNQT